MSLLTFLFMLHLFIGRKIWVYIWYPILEQAVSYSSISSWLFSSSQHFTYYSHFNFIILVFFTFSVIKISTRIFSAREREGVLLYNVSFFNNSSLGSLICLWITDPVVVTISFMLLRYWMSWFINLVLVELVTRIVDVEKKLKSTSRVDHNKN